MAAARANQQSRPVRISQALAPAEIDAARALFKEYATGLGVDLCFQGFAAELAGLPGSYAPPHGRILLAWADSVAVGCVALRPLAADTCEMKRMFVQPGFRGQGLGRQLAEAILAEARDIGYTTMKLDTLPTIRAATRLYETLGFVRCSAYYNTPLSGTIFMERHMR
jgi:putative acetyltransferase